MPRAPRTALVFFLQAALLTAAAHLPRVHRNPAIEIAGIAEASEGFLWLAASDGLYRFDGLHFDKVDGFPFSSARFVAVAPDGKLWVGGGEGLASYDGAFSVVLRQSVLGMTVSLGRVFVNLFQLSVIGKDGIPRQLTGHSARADLSVDGAGTVWYSCGPANICGSGPSDFAVRTQLQVATNDPITQAYRDSRGRLWAADDEAAGPVENGSRVTIFRRPPARGWRPGPLLPGRNGQLWLIGDTTVGVAPPIEFQDRWASNDYRATAAYEDRRGHLWVAMAGLGLVEWTSDASWQRWSSDEFASQPVAQIVRSDGGAVIAATVTGLYRLDPDSGKWRPMTGDRLRFSYVLPSTGGGFLAAIRKYGIARLSNSGEILERPPSPIRPSPWGANVIQAVSDNYRKLIRDAQGRVWVGSKLGLYRLEGTSRALFLRREPMPGERVQIGGGDYLTNAVDFELDRRGRLWTGYQEGVAWLDDTDHWRLLPVTTPIPEVRSFAVGGETPGDEIWVAFRRLGPFVRLLRNGSAWTVTEFDPDNGYGPRETFFIKRDSRGWIWRGATDGVHISDGRHFAPNDWLHIGPENGLATTETDQYSFFEDADGSVWIGGKQGVSHLHPTAAWFDAPRQAPPPRVTRVEADGRSLPVSDRLPVSQRLRLQIGALDTPPFRNAPFRYRLLPVSREWAWSADGLLEFPKLAARAYTLEVGYAGNGPSAVLTFAFQVMAAPGWSFPWRWAGGSLLMASLAGLAMRSPRLERVRYRATKRLFLLRRRLSRANSSDHPSARGGDLSGALLANRYRLVRQLAHGGFSVVYDARDLAENTRVVVKILNLDPNTPASVRNRFGQEVAALRSIQHAGIVPIVDSWVESRGEPCLAMRFLNGATLRAVLDGGRLPPARVARVTRQLGAALAEVHRRGIVHRDLKPENIILVDAGSETEQAVIIDFGTAGFRGPELSLATTTQLSGSFHYLAPERLAGRFSTASDIYALGVIVLEMITGNRLADLRAMHGEPEFLPELEARLAPAPAAATLARLLAPSYAADPRERPVDAGAWADEIAAALLGGG